MVVKVELIDVKLFKVIEGKDDENWVKEIQSLKVKDLNDKMKKLDPSLECWVVGRNLNMKKQIFFKNQSKIFWSFRKYDELSDHSRLRNTRQFIRAERLEVLAPILYNKQSVWHRIWLSTSLLPDSRRITSSW